MVDKDRVAGAGKRAVGAAKKAVGKVLGDKKLQNEGRAEEAESEAQNAIGGVKDKVREFVREE